MSHQDRRLPLPADYQFPTHGVDCDCPPCRNKYFGFPQTEQAWSCVNRGICDGTQRVWLGRVAYCAKCGANSISGYMPDLRSAPTTQTAYGWGV
jgi:hypothetical protein